MQTCVDVIVEQDGQYREAGRQGGREVGGKEIGTQGGREVGR